MRFADRTDAGRQLAALFTSYAARPDVLVLGLPRGGVPVAFEIAERLGVALDVLVVRKLGVPGQPELAMGAIAEGDVEVLNGDLVTAIGIPDELIRQAVARERLELDRRVQLFRGGQAPLPIRDRTVILVDDGLATGATMEAAIIAARQQSPARLVIAAPVGAPDTVARLGRLADDIVCLAMPEPFRAVGLWYDEFSQTTDDDVRALLARCGQPPAHAPAHHRRRG